MDTGAPGAPAPRSPTRTTIREEDIVTLVHRFYAAVRRDPVLGPVFGAHVHDWDAHLATLVDFWSGLLRGTRRFRGMPVTRHLALPGLEAAMFERWLEIFEATTAGMDHPWLKAEADEQARQMARRLWQRYREHRDPAGTA